MIQLLMAVMLGLLGGSPILVMILFPRWSRALSFRDHEKMGLLMGFTMLAAIFGAIWLGPPDCYPVLHGLCKLVK